MLINFVFLFLQVPKLIGSCAVRLDESIQLISKDVHQLGLSVPSVHGEKGEFAVYNLMGSEIGKLELGYRLLSLGRGLIPHLPDNSILEFEEKTAETKEEVSVKTTADLVIHDIQAADKTVQVELVTNTAEQQAQTDEGAVQDTGTQTRNKSSRTLKESSDFTRDLFVTNTICPPPLFYNSEAEPKKHGLTFADFQDDSQAGFINGMIAVQGQQSVMFDELDKYSEYSDSTIRHEDKFSDSEDEKFRDVDPAEEARRKAPLRKTLLKSSPAEWRNQLMHTGAPNVLNNMTEFPMLNALLNEILNLQGVGGYMSQSRRLAIQSDSQASVQRSTSKSRRPEPNRAQESRDKFLQRLSTPRGHGEPTEGFPGYHRGKRTCASPQKGVPRNKSWLRKEPDKAQAEYGVRKTKLFYGLTNTQRLRLAKGNPEWLRKQQMKEDLRLAEKKQKGLMKGKPEERPDMKGLTISLDAAGESRDSFISPKQHRRPVPTPRLSLAGNKKLQLEKHFAQGSEGDLKKSEGTPTEASESSERSYHTTEPQDSDRSKRRDADGFPDGRGFSDTTSETEREDTERSIMGATKVLSGPGFPREAAESRLSMVSAFSVQYSDDFEDDKAGYSPELTNRERQRSESSADSTYRRSSIEGNQPSLKKFVEKRSDDDDDDDDDTAALSGEEPSLRRVYEQYSDDSASEDRNSRSNGDFQSARSSQSSPEQTQKNSDTLKNLPMPNPTSSLLSPIPHHKVCTSGVIRERLAASSEESDSDADSSTARIPRSQMPSQSFDTATSLDSTGELWRRRRAPRPSPRRSLEKIRTESVSSYNPSDPENVSPIPLGEQNDLISEVLDEENLSSSEVQAQPQYVKDLKIPSSAKGLGYTWT